MIQNARSATEDEGAPKKRKLKSRPIAATLILTGGVVLLLFSIGLSIALGAADIKFSPSYAPWAVCSTLFPSTTPTTTREDSPRS